MALLWFCAQGAIFFNYSYGQNQIFLDFGFLSSFNECLLGVSDWWRLTRGLCVVGCQA
jgi:hypothetical protein